MVNPSKALCSDFSKSVMLISSVILSVACLAGLIHVEFELSVHREMLRVLHQQMAENFEPKDKKLPDEAASEMKMLPSDSNKEIPFRFKRHSRGTTNAVTNSSVQGIQGIQGLPGPKGDQGPEGPKVNPGESISAPSIVSPPKSCSDIKKRNPGNSSGYYIIDPDGHGSVASFRVYCDMRDKGGVGVTVISHDSESRTHVGNIPGCYFKGCYSKSVTYTGASTAQLAALTRVSKNCEQFIKFECNNDVGFVVNNYAWWVSRDGRKMSYWGGAPKGSRMCACGVTNSCSHGRKCNCYNSSGGWREDSGSLTDKAALPVSQIKLGDLNDSNEEGYHTLGKLKCYGVA